MRNALHACGHRSKYFVYKPDEEKACPVCSSDFVLATKLKDRLKAGFTDQFNQAQALNLPTIQHHYAVVAQAATLSSANLYKEWRKIEGHDISVIQNLLSKALVRTNAHEWLHAKPGFKGLEQMASHP